jgi:hypothetical protein
MPPKAPRVGEDKYEERWSHIEAKLKEYKELISSINKTSVPKISSVSSRRKERSCSRPLRAPRASREPSIAVRERSIGPLKRASSIAKKPQTSSLSISGISCLHPRQGPFSSRSSVSSSSSSLPKLQPVGSVKVCTGQTTDKVVRSSSEAQTTHDVCPPPCSLSPLTLDEPAPPVPENNLADEAEVKLINSELRQLLLSP